MKPLRLVCDHVNWSPTRDQLTGLLQRIQTEEGERAMQYVFRKDIRPTLVGRAMLRYAVCAASGLSNDEVRLTRSAKGKPTCAQLPPGWDVNLSHHGNYCVLALDAADKVGVDLMKVETRERNLDQYFALMKRIYTDSEWAFVREAGSDHQRLARFMRLWALKEAYVKAEGFGITVDLQAICFRCRSDSLSPDRWTRDTELRVDGRLMTDWSFEESMIDEEHVVAVARSPGRSRGAGDEEAPPPHLLRITVSQLIDSLHPLTRPPEQEDSLSKWTAYCGKSESPGS